MTTRPGLMTLSGGISRDPEWLHWRDQALCKELTSQQQLDDFAERGSVENAKALCRECPVRTQCLADALDSRKDSGVWGSLSSRERRALLRRQPNITSWQNALFRFQQDVPLVQQQDDAAWQRLLETSANPELNRILEQAQAESAAQSQPPIHPRPNTRADLRTIATQSDDLGQVLATLREQQVPLTVAEVEATINGLASIRATSIKSAWQIGLHAVERGLISQAKLAQLLGASTATVSRRYHQTITAAEEERMTRADARTEHS